MDNNQKIFSENLYYSEFKPIRNKFRKYQSESIIKSCIDYLHHPTENEFTELQKSPWLVLLLLKWVLIDENYTRSSKKELSKQEFCNLLNSIIALSNFTKLPNNEEGFRLFFRMLAYQQFIYQRNFSFNHLARQYLLFGNLDKNSLIRTQFKEVAGVEISSFIELSVATLARVIVQEKYLIPTKWFSSLENSYSYEEVDKFIKCISSSILDIRERLIQNDNGKRNSHEYYEQTPFIEFPLISTQHGFLCVHRMVLFRALENYIYDKLKIWNAEKFMRKFGTIFERYVDNTLNYTGLTYADELTLKKHLNIEKKVVDFMVTDNDSNIFIDAKAVEMARQGKVTQSAKIIKDRVKTSIKKQ